MLAASKSTLISALDFSQNAPVASYITDRSSIQLYPSGGNDYTPSGVRSIRFSLTTTGPFIDLSSIALMATCHNTSGTHPLRFLGPNLGVIFQEIRCYIGGTQVEHVQYANRTESMLSRFQNVQKRIQEYDEGWGWESGSFNGNDFKATAIDANGSRKVVWRPKTLGICSQPNYLPSAMIGNGGMVLEFILTGDAASVCDTDTSGSPAVAGSGSFRLDDVRLLCDVVSVQGEFLSSMSKHLLGGGALTMSFKQYQTTLYSINNVSAQLVHGRALSRLNSFFVTFSRPLSGTHAETTDSKEINTFYLSPNGQGITLRCMAGEKSFPDNAISNLSEFWHRLLGTVGVLHSGSHCVSITKSSYASDQWVCGIDTEKVPGQSHGSGLNTHSAQLSLDLRNLGSTSADWPSNCFLTTWSEAMLEITADGVSVAT